MARAEVINLKEWDTPNTYDRQYRALPETGGVYLLALREFLFNSTGIVVKQTISYVGSSGSLSERCNNHPVKNKILSNHKVSVGADVACYFKVCDNYKEEEKRLIKLTQARYNRQWR